MDLMPHKKSWVSPDGVVIEMITYRTILVDRLRDALRKYKYEDGELPDSLAAFILCAATTTDVQFDSTLAPHEIPLWGQFLHDMVKNPMWLRDPAKDYDAIVYAPSDMTDNWWEAYQATRDTANQAPAELQVPPPRAPEPDPETGEVDQNALNFITSNTPNGGTPLMIISSGSSEKPLAGRRKAK
jgi:hypothetical protein